MGVDSRNQFWPLGCLQGGVATLPAASCHRLTLGAGRMGGVRVLPAMVQISEAMAQMPEAMAQILKQ